ncbi:MAG: MgtC/SapB family protein [Clostridium sp.]|nr:MgtC/SapB family protein [Prevotella sp.]MCM1429682.1 MgtC/SapB family protein [Clostridium sp.]MCM1476163.1 MgtC/SapB family protein [Muribaculaceae bacterium]
MEDTLQFILADLNSTEVTIGNSVFRLILSMILGVLVGAERKRKGQIAGVRTFALISMGACMAMLLSIYVPQVYLGLKNGDPGRIAAQVITGVGFLGGGAMIHMKGSVKGLTTAAGIWMTAIIGMTTGVGMYACSLIATALILVTLVWFETVEHRRNIGQENRALKLHVRGIITDITPYKEVFDRHEVHLNTYFLEYDYQENITHFSFMILAPSHRNYLPMFTDLSQLGDTLTLRLTAPS